MSFSAQYFAEVGLTGRSLVKGNDILPSAAALLVFLVQSVISIPFGLVGAIFSSCARGMKGGNNGFLLAGNASPITLQGKVNFLSLNCNGIAGSQIFDATTERFARLDPLYKKIGEHIDDEQPFVFCGQECFGYFAYALADKFKEKTACSALRGRGKIFGMDNGLALFTNLKIESVVYRSFSKIPFLSRGSVDHGYQIANFGKFVVINTHFDKGTDDAIEKGKLATLHKKALEEIQETVDELKLNNLPIYFAGDLNNQELACKYWDHPVTTCTNEMEICAGITEGEIEETTLDVLSLWQEKAQPEAVCMVPYSDHYLLKLEAQPLLKAAPCIPSRL